MLTRRKREKVDAEEAEVSNKIKKESNSSKENPFLNGDIIKILAQNAGVGELAGLRQVSAQYHDAMSKPFFDKLPKTVVLNPNGSMRLAWIDTVNTISIPKDEITWANDVSKRRCLTLKNWNPDLASKFQISTILVKEYNLPEDPTKNNFNPQMEQLLQMLEPTVKELRFDYVKVRNRTERIDPSYHFNPYSYKFPELPSPIAKFISKFKHLESIQLSFDYRYDNDSKVTPKQILQMIQDVNPAVEILVMFDRFDGNVERFQAFLRAFSSFPNIKVDFQRVEVTAETIGTLTSVVQENSSKLHGFGMSLDFDKDSFIKAQGVRNQLGLVSPYLTSLEIGMGKNGPDILSGLIFPKLKSLYMYDYHCPIGHGGILPNCPLLDHLWLSIDHKDCIFITDGEENEMSDLKAAFESLTNLEELKFIEYARDRANNKILPENKYHQYLQKLLPSCKVIVRLGRDWDWELPGSGDEDSADENGSGDEGLPADQNDELQ